jgi:hypothetical protein
VLFPGHRLIRLVGEVFDDNADMDVVVTRHANSFRCFLPVHRYLKLASHANLVECGLDNSRYVFGVRHGLSLVISGTEGHSAMLRRT